MDINTSSLTISMGCVLLVSLSWIILNWIWLKPKRLERFLRQQGFQGNPYRLLHGDTKERAKMTTEAMSEPMPNFSNDYLYRTHPFLHHTMTKYGKRCFIWNGQVPLVSIIEPELMREVLMKINEFQKPNHNPVIKKIATGLVLLEGKIWAKRRKLLNPAFHMEKLKFMLPALQEIPYGMIKNWEEMASETGSCEIEVWSELKKLTADFISRAAFGSSFEEGKRIFELITEQLMVALPMINSVYIPGWRFIPTKANRRIAGIDKEIRVLIKGIIDKRMKQIYAGEKPKEDLLGTLLESCYPEMQQQNKRQAIELTFEDVVNECKLFYFAGQDTVASLLVWTLILLAKHQIWQTRAREEVLSTFGDRIIDFEGLKHLKIVTLILQEGLRLYPPALEISRRVNENIKIKDIFLPKGVLVNLPNIVIQQDEKLWGEDAKEFKPERFIDGISKASEGNLSFFTFGWGPRVCIGSNFAMMEAKMTLALILQRFTFDLSPSYVHAPSALGALRPQFGAQISFQKL